MSTKEKFRQLAHAFEGDPFDVRNIQKEYLRHFQNARRVLDIGCGQGIFLNLLRERGCQAEGVDWDEAMVSLCRAEELEAFQGDVLEFLTKTPNRYDGIFASHIVEHFQGEEAFKLLERCHDLLKPDGVIVVVTPNFRNPAVAQEVFWLDITHVRPYPELLVIKMLEALNFAIVEHGANAVGLNDTYVVGRKT